MFKSDYKGEGLADEKVSNPIGKNVQIASRIVLILFLSGFKSHREECSNLIVLVAISILLCFKSHREECSNYFTHGKQPVDWLFQIP